MGMLQPQPQIQTQKHSGPFSHLRHVQREVSAKAIPSRPFPQRGSNGSSSISRDVPRAQSQRACKPEKHKRFLAFRVQPAGRPSALRPTPESLLRVRIAWHPALPTRPPVIPPSGGRGGAASASPASKKRSAAFPPLGGRWQFPSPEPAWFPSAPEAGAPWLRPALAPATAPTPGASRRPPRSQKGRAA